MKKTNLGSVPVMLHRSEANALLQMLGTLMGIDGSSIVSQEALKLMQKIMRHGRTFTKGSDEKVSIYFYENEATDLIRLTALYLNAMQIPAEDYFDRIGLSHKKGLGFSQSAEQTVPADCKGNP